MCGTVPSRKPTSEKNTKECQICYKRIAADDYADHVNKCADRSSSKSMISKDTKECFICYKEIAEADFERHVHACLSGSSSTVNTKSIIRTPKISCFAW